MGRSYAHVLRLLYDEPWALLPAKLELLLQIVGERLDGLVLSAEEIEQRIGAAQRPGQSVTGNVAVIPVFGVLAQHAGLLDGSGGTSTDGLSQKLRQAAADPAIGGIVLNVDSPGGSVYGIQELGAEIASLRARTPVVAVANSLCASAAYWLASQASELVVTPGGEVGSIGVLAMHQDVSRAADAQGVTTTMVHAGKYKTEGNPYEPLGNEARAWIQARVDDYYQSFVSAVASGRGVSADQVRSGFGEGRVVGAKQAVKLGMADRVATLDATIARLQSGRARVKSPGAEGDAAEFLAEVDAAIRSGAAHLTPPAQETEPEADSDDGLGDLDFRRRRLRLAGRGAG